MALDTYAGLLEALGTWSSNVTVAAARGPDFVTWAHQEINRRLRANVMLATGDLTISAETISQPTGFLAMKRLYLDVTPRQKVETTSAEAAADMCAQIVTVQYPTHVAKEGTLLHFAPLFTWTGTGKALFYKAATTMSADGDTNVVLAAYPYLYLYGALEALYSYQEDDNMADRYGQKFGALIEDINTRDAKDTMSGELQSRPWPGGIV